jgi:hypothetical protein
MLLNKNPYTNKMLDTLDKIDAGDLTTKGSDITQDILDDVLTEYTQQVNNKIKKLEAIADATYNKL